MAAADQVIDDNWIAIKDFPIQIVDDSRYPYEMIVTMLRSSPWSDTERWTDAFLNADNIRAWQNSTPEGKIFLAYMIVGALSGDHYFNDVPMSARAGWTDADGNPTATAPSWLLCPDSAYSRLNYVAFWHPDWKKHLLTEVEYALTIGANGVFLDAFQSIVDKLNADPGCARGQTAGVDLEREMIQLSQEIRAYIDSKGLGRPFWIVVSDGQTLHKKYPDIVRHIDASLREHMFFVGWNLPDFMNGPEEPWRTEESSRFVDAMAAAGIPVFGLEYVTDPAKIQRLAEFASTRCFVPSVSESKLLVISKPRNLMYCDNERCTNNGVFLATRQLTGCPLRQSPKEKLTLSLGTNQSTFAPSNSLVVSAAVGNPGFAKTVDFYFGVLLPDGDTVVLFTNLAFASVGGSLANPETLRPIVGGVDLRTPFTVNQPVFFTYTWTGSEPPGSYVLFIAATKAGALADKTIDPDDIVALSTATVAFAP